VNRELEVTQKRMAETNAKSIRAFIAIKLPDDVIERLREAQTYLKHEGLDIKWVRPENIHLTLKFLGDIRQTDVDAVGKALTSATAPFAPLTLSASGLGAFPSVKRPRVIWSGLRGDLEVLARLHARLEEELSALGMEKESKAFKGHLTLGRIKGKVNPDVMIDAFSKYGHMTSRGFVADTLYLIKSDLKPSGPVYTDLISVRMGAG